LTVALTVLLSAKLTCTVHTQTHLDTQTDTQTNFIAGKLTDQNEDISMLPTTTEARPDVPPYSGEIKKQYEQQHTASDKSQV